MIIPAIDLINGNVVRLYQGDYQKQRNYKSSALFYLQDYIKQGATMLHLIDLSGAFNPSMRQISLLNCLLSSLTSTMVQVGGGIRSITDIKKLLQAGASRVIIGSIAIEKPQEVKFFFKYFNPDMLVLACDVRISLDGKKTVAIKGWSKNSNKTLEELIAYYRPVGLKHVLCTDISRDGTFIGSNILLYRSICNIWPDIFFQASGGINNLKDLIKLRNSGVHGVIVGRALLEKKFTFLEALKCWQNE